MLTESRTRPRWSIRFSFFTVSRISACQASQSRLTCATSRNVEVCTLSFLVASEYLLTLQCYTGLRTLSLQGTNLDYASSVRNIFPNLVELNMESACMPLSTANVFFRAENFPSLRVFGLHNSAAFEETYGSWQRKYFAYPLSPTFLDRFELFQYTPPISDVSGSLPPWSRAPTLFTIRRSFETFFANFLTMSPSYLRLVLMPDEIQYDFTFPDFADLSAVISKAKNLRILFLPAFISPASENELKPDAKEKIKGLLDVCKERDVEIIWHDEDDESGWAISPAFRRYAGRLRAEQAEGVRDGA